MKKVVLVFILSALFNFSCQTRNSAVNSENKTVVQSENMTSQADSSKKFGDLEISYKIKVAADRAVNITYRIKNSGADDYIIFNQGHTNRKETDPVYIEEAGGVIEFSQKAFSKPEGVMCPNSLVPVVARGVVLKAGGELSGEAIARDFSQSFTPYDFCVAPQPIDSKIKRAKFCLGAAKANGERVKLDERGNVENVNSFVAKQNLLCSDEINLEK